MRRREFLKAAGAGAAGLLLPRRGAPGSGAPRRPNIIFILADDLGYGDLGCYGQKQVRTPRLDRMAAEGMRFTQSYAGSTVCAPSRCVLMTGLHTGHCLVRANGRVPLRPEDVTVAKVLKEAGCATGLVGKWGLGDEGSTGLPTRQGFDGFFGYLSQTHAHNYYPPFLLRDERRVPLRNVMPAGRDGGPGVAVKKVEYSHDLLTAEAIRFVEGNKDRPFFLYLAYTVPHANNEAGRNGMEVPDYGPYAEKPWPEAQKGHAAMIGRLDRDVGQLLDRLKALGLDGETVVFFSSDNGPHREGGADPAFFDSNGPLRGIKRDLYEGGIRVPMIVRWPGKVKPGGVSDHVGYFADFLPTAAELAGVDGPAGLDGISVAPTLLGRPQRAHEALYWEFRGSQAVRMGRFKTVRKRLDGPIELYDLEKDVGEGQDVAAQQPAVVERIRGYLAAARTESEHWPLVRPDRRRR